MIFNLDCSAFGVDQCLLNSGARPPWGHKAMLHGPDVNTENRQTYAIFIGNDLIYSE